MLLRKSREADEALGEVAGDLALDGPAASRMIRNQGCDGPTRRRPEGGHEQPAEVEKTRGRATAIVSTATVNRDGSSAVTHGNGSTATATVIPRRPAAETVARPLDRARFAFTAGENAASARLGESLRAAKRHWQPRRSPNCRVPCSARLPSGRDP